ncbi:MAG: phosphoribosylformylglycinamidine synthase subunit PurL [Thermoplasmata archaeon]|nr:MAG: phosphoribosylformylglycinamidine synthase subunit PurL [Thermoplasmata archaeon]
MMKRLYNEIPVYEINLVGADDKTLAKISKEWLLNLSLEEMRKVRDFFVKIGRNPTDVELQAIAQAWSEHCSYKSSKAVLKKFIFNIDAPQNILVIKEDAGVVEFDDEHAYVVALESHNHPSAIEPYGGAATGIGGILRDVACMGAQPIALIDPLFFGPLDMSHDALPRGVNHPKFLFAGVIAGIRDYGNRVGIPTVAGMVYFDNGYIGNCLVNVGCVGVVRKDRITRSMAKNPGSYFMLAGGKTGRDGIHGVTFASADLDVERAEEVKSAVQLGDPIMKEPLIHACLEAVNKGLVEGMKDCGGGGLSSAIGEMAYAGGFGADIYLEKVPLKEEGMAPWEIWVSESQERMVLVISPSSVDDVLRIFKKWDVEATIIGRVVEERRIRVYYQGKKVLDMPLDFYTKGPEYERTYVIPNITEVQDEWEEPKDYNDIMLKMLAMPNIASKEWVIRQYDHEVRGATVIKPMQGVLGHYTHGDAAVIKPLEHSYRGLAITVGVNPSFVALNPYWGACSAIDEVCRNLVAVGATPHSFADCLNFGNPERPDRFGYFYEAVRGLGDIARALGVPFVSGNVSFYNESVLGSVPPTPTIMGCGIVADVRKCITADLKMSGSIIYLVGETKRELGGSEYARLLGLKETVVPKVNFDMLRASINSLLRAIDYGLVEACHDLSHGGLGVAIAEMCIGGKLGAEIDISVLGGLRSDIKLFSESNTRWLVEVREENAHEFEKVMGSVPLYAIGRVGGDRLVVRDGNEIITLGVREMKVVWDEALPNML